MLDGQGIRHWKVRGDDVIWGVFPAFAPIRKITSLFCRNPLSLRKSLNSALFNRLLRQRWVGWLGSSSQPPWCSNLIPSRHLFPWCFVKDETYILPIAITLNNVKDRIRTAVGLLLQNADNWYVVEYRLDACMATMVTNGAHSKLAQGMTNKEKQPSNFLFTTIWL